MNDKLNGAGKVVLTLLALTITIMLLLYAIAFLLDIELVV